MNYSQIKALISIYGKDVIKEWGAETILIGHNQGYISSSTTEFAEYGGEVYDQDSYIVCGDGVIEHNDFVVYCDYSEEYYQEDDTFYNVQRDRDELQVHSGWISKACNVWNLTDVDDLISNTYLDDSAMERNDIVVDCDGYVRYRDDVYYWESDGEYHSDPEEEDDNYVRGYHNNKSPYFYSFSDSPKYYIGFEIEKEDASVKESEYIEDFEDRLKSGFRKERDGSLCDYSGMEIITPAFELDVEFLRKELEPIESYINAEYSSSCGGHINVSVVGKTGAETFDMVSGYLPLLYAMYPKRVGVNYCQGKSKSRMKVSADKYQAIKLTDSYIEFRIFSAVENMDQLMFRSSLIKMMLDNHTNCEEEALKNVITIFQPILRESIYKDQEKWYKMLKRFCTYAQEFEEVELTIN